MRGDAEVESSDTAAVFSSFFPSPPFLFVSGVSNLNPWKASEPVWRRGEREGVWVDGCSKAALYTPGIPPAGCRNHWRDLISVERAEEIEDS